MSTTITYFAAWLFIVLGHIHARSIRSQLPHPLPSSPPSFFQDAGTPLPPPPSFSHDATTTPPPSPSFYQPPFFFQDPDEVLQQPPPPPPLAVMPLCCRPIGPRDTEDYFSPDPSSKGIPWLRIMIILAIIAMVISVALALKYLEIQPENIFQVIWAAVTLSACL